MSEDLTQNLPQSDSEKLTLTLSILQLLSGQISEVKTDVRELKTDFREISTSIRDIGRRFTVINETLMSIQVDYRDLYDRVRSLERAHNPPNTET